MSAFRLHSPCAGYVCPGPPAPAYFIAYRSLTATRIGAGYQVLSSDHAGAVWLVSYPRSTDNIATTSASAQLVSTAGQPLGPRYTLPPGYQLDAGVGSYLLLNPWSGKPPNVSELWDPRTGQVVRRLDNVSAVGPDQIAWSTGCRACQVQILNVSTGQNMITPIPEHIVGPTFSDDGRLLAMQLPNGSLGVFDTQTQALTVIPGTALPSDCAQSFWWQDGGHRLIVLAAPGNSYMSSDTTQVAYWQPGDTRFRVVTIQIPGGLSSVMNGGMLDAQQSSATDVRQRHSGFV